MWYIISCRELRYEEKKDEGTNSYLSFFCVLKSGLNKYGLPTTILTKKDTKACLREKIINAKHAFFVEGKIGVRLTPILLPVLIAECSAGKSVFSVVNF
ncbi:MAG: hypothetical protein AB1422_19395 [bacterium]